MKRPEHRWPDNDKSGCLYSMWAIPAFMVVGGLIGWVISLVAGA